MKHAVVEAEQFSMAEAGVEEHFLGEGIAQLMVKILFRYHMFTLATLIIAALLIVQNLR